MPGLGSLVSGLTPPGSKRKSDAYLVELGDDDAPLRDADKPSIRKFQYYPDSVSDTKAVNYATKEVPGGSLPLYQYVGSGERIISFTAIFTSDIDYYADRGMTSDLPVADVQAYAWNSVDRQVDTVIERTKASGVSERNVFIPAALVWLRRFMLPRYGTGLEVEASLTKPPHKLMLLMPGTMFARSGGASGEDKAGMVCIMTQCDITYEALFPSGCPRKASVSLAFAQVPQRGGAVVFPQSTDDDDKFAASFYQLGPPASKSGAVR